MVVPLAQVDGKIIRHSECAHNALEHNYIEMIQATPEKYVLLGSFEPKGLCAFTSPAVADGRMYLRLRDGLACYDLRAK